MDDEGRNRDEDPEPDGRHPPGESCGAGELSRHELSVVRADLRGFTAYCEAAGPEEAVELLRDYYAVIAAESTALDAAIKEHAGDGTLVLVGAAQPAADHAERAVALALAIMVRAEGFLAPRRNAGANVGLGIGVASGVVTVGLIEAGTRTESVAVGAAVNLASRLCSRAKAGQILVAERTLELASADGMRRFERVEEAPLKGFARPVPIFQALRR